MSVPVADSCLSGVQDGDRYSKIVLLRDMFTGKYLWDLCTSRWHASSSKIVKGV